MRKTMRSRSHSADSHHLPSVEQQQPQPSPIMQAIALTTVNTNQFKINFTAYNNADQLIELLNWLVAQQDLLLWQEIWSWLLVSRTKFLATITDPVVRLANSGAQSVGLRCYTQ